MRRAYGILETGGASKECRALMMASLRSCHIRQSVLIFHGSPCFFEGSLVLQVSFSGLVVYKQVEMRVKLEQGSSMIPHMLCSVVGLSLSHRAFAYYHLDLSSLDRGQSLNLGHLSLEKLVNSALCSFTRGKLQQSSS